MSTPLHPLPVTTDPDEPTRKRQRARKACLPCRQRKRKCDNVLPCSMCTTYGYQCQFSQDDSPTAAFVEKVGSSGLSNGPRNSPVTMNMSYKQPYSHGLGAGGARPIVTREADTSSSTARSSVAPPAVLVLLDPMRRRFMGLHSVTAFPRSLGLDFQSANPPRVHSFAYNCGIRLEEEGSAHADLRETISRQDFNRYADVYFETVHPLFVAFDQQLFLQNVDVFWKQSGPASIFEAILAGVAALGSFFSARRGCTREAELVSHAKGILEDPTFQPTIDHVSAWILRTLYLRATTRPHLAWLASCTTIHLAEATGLHIEIDQIAMTEPDTGHSALNNQNLCELVRRIFWTAWRNNMMVSYEYGRSGISLSNVTCKIPRYPLDDIGLQLHAIVELVPRDNADGQDPNLHGTLEKAKQIPDTHPFVSMSKADLCMSLYRHHRLLKLSTDKSDVSKILEIGNVAVNAALKLAEENKFWWNVLCTVFQYVCVLLALDTADSLSNVSNAMSILEKIARLLGTHMAQEAVNTAKVLLRDSTRKKRLELDMLEVADVGEGQGDAPADLAGLDINWDMLLDPWYMSNFQGMAGLGEVYPMGDFNSGGTMN
ncbi:hypothetical protein WAI453_011154 [Rhynchosporium graminicola]|uniref:Related to RDR1 Transcriptional repressor (Zinc cluster protein), Repressor of drug resistance n=1 Tax=Rhynchosporium graminicola TaxID=2792576 RepID=A0A1E1LJR1_9HELO|nr:related to RDR1 Transcriptional repressor (zinc cluster protein), Repressor of drug resistance [Rhynchosporium commune]